MFTARRTFVATGTVAVLAAAGVTAAIAADPAPAPPPKIAFLANGIVPADALAAGPIAGQLGAPIYTTQPDALSSAAATGLGDYDPELVIVLGGPVAIHDTVITQVENATGLTHTDDVTPAGGIVRAAGGDRFDTAAAVADLLTAYNPAYLPINMQAIDADTVDGKDSTDFLGASGKAVDAEKLDGKDSTDFATESSLPRLWVERASSGGVMTDANDRTDLVEMTFTAPGDGQVNVEGFVYMLQREAGDPSVNLRLWLDGTMLVNSSVDLAAYGDSPQNATFTVPWVFPVEEGETYTLTMSAIAFGTTDLDIAYSQQQIEAEFWPQSQVSVNAP